jgi:arsenite methyltransferase
VICSADGLALPFESNSFDVVISHWVMHTIFDEAKRRLALAEIATLLRPGGQLLFNDLPL